MPNKLKHGATRRSQELAPTTVKAINDLADGWAALDAENAEPEVPPGARSLQELCVIWKTSDSIGQRKAWQLLKAGKMARAKITRSGRRICVYWPVK